MSFKKNYHDYLQPKVEDIERAGFAPRHTNRKSGTTYYVSDTCEYVLAFTSTGYPVILDKETYEKIEGISIHMNFKEYHNENILPVPRIGKDGKYLKLHRVVMNANKGVQVDHINHNQSCCIKENLRCCNNRQNTINRQDKCGVHEYHKDGQIRYAYDLKADGCVRVYHNSMVECYLAYRDTARELYKGTGMEYFVYDIENDFSKTTGLLIHYYIMGDITEEEMYQMNLDFWRDKLDNAPALQMVI